MNESQWQTRNVRIDTCLRSCNPPWQIVPWKSALDVSTLTCHAVTEFPTEHGPADYAFSSVGMEDLKRTLNQNRFEPETLQRAHKYTAITAAPEERVNWALDKFIQDHTPTQEQMQWLYLICGQPR